MRVIAALSAFLASACAYNPPPVRVEATPADMEALAGEWYGEYRGWTSGRSGSVVFRLVAGDDHAHGDVLMVPRGAKEPYGPFPADGRARVSSQVLTIRFVAVQGGRIAGALEPYFDPDCNCRAVTRFYGLRRGEVVEGTFTTFHENRVEPSGGEWNARRRPGGA